MTVLLMYLNVILTVSSLIFLKDMCNITTTCTTDKNSLHLRKSWPTNIHNFPMETTGVPTPSRMAKVEQGGDHLWSQTSQLGGSPPLIDCTNTGNRKGHVVRTQHAKQQSKR